MRRASLWRLLQEVPAGGDLYILKQILLNWDDEHAQRILANCHRGAAPGSKLLVIEWLLPSDPGPSGVHLLNLNARDARRPAALGRGLRAAAQLRGYHVEQIIPTVASSYPWSIIEAARR